MSTQINVPELDQEKLQQATNEAAMKGAIDVIKDFYQGYNSPYKEKIREEFKNKKLNTHFDIPDILAVINDQISKEIDTIANSAVLNTYLPLVKEFLLRAPSEIKFSEFLKEFISIMSNNNESAYSISIDLHPRYGWLEVTMKCENKQYDFTMHKNYEKETYSILSLPYGFQNKSGNLHCMEITSENVNVKLPFTREVLSDKFVSFIARLIIAHTNIEMDVDQFQEDFFSED